MVRPSYYQILRRRRDGKTDYETRKRILLARKPFASVRVSSKNVLVQVAEADSKGDRIISSAHSRELGKYGWTASRKSLPAAYLTGFLAGAKAVTAGVRTANLYVAVKPFRSGSRVAAALKGLQDGGVDVPADEDAFPSGERLSGAHIATFAESVLSRGSALYRSRFSGMIRSGFKPEGYADHFGTVLTRIKGTSMVKGDE